MLWYWNLIKKYWRSSLWFHWCKSFLELNSPDILALFETNLDDSINSSKFNFSVRVFYLQSKMILLLMYMFLKGLMEGLILQGSYLAGFTLFSVLFLIPLSISIFVFVHDFWCIDNIDEVLLVNPSICRVVTNLENLEKSMNWKFWKKIREISGDLSRKWLRQGSVREFKSFKCVSAEFFWVN